MLRRRFLQAGAVALGSQIGAKPLQPRRVTLQNEQLAWHLDIGAEGVRSVALENRRSGNHYNLLARNEFTLVFSASPRIEIPWWHFRLTDNGDVLPERETGITAEFHRSASPTTEWKPVDNLAGGQRGRIYEGYGWFRRILSLPDEARGKSLTFVLGGYDEQDWNEHWVYLNGTEIGHRKISTRWRMPGSYTVRPVDTAYAALQFGPESKNILAVRARGYDYGLGGLRDEALVQYVYRPFLFDQFVSIGDPYKRSSRFTVRAVDQHSSQKVSVTCEDSTADLLVTAHYEITGFVRRKWLEVHNRSDKPKLLLDVELDSFRTTATSQGGGHGKPVFLDEDLFGAIEHPAGINQATGGDLLLWHCPGRQIAPGETFKTLSAVVGVAPPKTALQAFHDYLDANSRRRRKGRVSIFTCFGTNNQWGACPTLNDAEVLDDQRVVAGWQAKGVKLDFFTLDTGWPANDGDLTEFVNTCYPDGPRAIVDGIHQRNMKFGLWFSEGWGGWANGSYPAIQAGAIPEAGSAEQPSQPPLASYRNGYPAIGGIGRQMCMAADSYGKVFQNALLHHVRENQARLVKFDSGNYYCNSTKHQHLPGKYSTEAISNRVISIVEQARTLAPDLFVMWYWGEGSPFWALHGDVISESGLFMEGSGTSQFPTLYYRDSVTLSLDQNTQFASLIPPMNKDSLGVWLSQIRWGNFMGRERWREALVMDLGRGSLVFPQLWGDPNLLNDSDIQFLAEMMELARAHDRTLLTRRHTFGDTWKNEVYGYAFGDGGRGLIVCHNAHFVSRDLDLKLDASLGLSAPAGTPLWLTAHFPERASVVTAAGRSLHAGDPVRLTMRPFETLLLEVQSDNPRLSAQRSTAITSTDYGSMLQLKPIELASRLDLKFADAARFDKAGMRRSVQCYSSTLPDMREDRHVLALTVKLTKDGKDFRYSPVVAEIVQIRATLAGRDLLMIPVPDARRFGNTQHAGCSWVLYKIPLAPKHSREPLEFAVHYYLPEGVQAQTEAWIVRQWWHENTRPEADGFYGDSPS